MSTDNRFRLMAILSGVVLLLAAPTWTQTEVKPGFNIFSLEQDIEIGAESAAEVAHQLPLLDDPTAQRYIEEVGERALSIVLSGRSPVTGELESVTVVTRGLPDGKLIYLLFIAPERWYAEVEQIMRSIVSSLSINDLALPR